MRGGTKFVNFIKKNWAIILIIIFLLGIFFYSYFSKGAIYSIVNSDTNSVIDYINSFGIFSYVIFVFFVILEVVLAPIPPLVLYVVGGAVFGTFFGGILTLLGNLIGAFMESPSMVARRLEGILLKRKWMIN